MSSNLPKGTEHSDIGSLITAAANEMEFDHVPAVCNHFLYYSIYIGWVYAYCVGYKANGDLVYDLDGLQEIDHRILRTRDWSEDMEALSDLGLDAELIIKIIDKGFSREVS